MRRPGITPSSNQGVRASRRPSLTASRSQVGYSLQMNRAWSGRAIRGHPAESSNE